MNKFCDFNELEVIYIFSYNFIEIFLILKITDTTERIYHKLNKFLKKEFINRKIDDMCVMTYFNIFFLN